MSTPENLGPQLLYLVNEFDSDIVEGKLSRYLQRTDAAMESSQTESATPSVSLTEVEGAVTDRRKGERRRGSRAFRFNGGLNNDRRRNGVD